MGKEPETILTPKENEKLYEYIQESKKIDKEIEKLARERKRITRSAIRLVEKANERGKSYGE